MVQLRGPNEVPQERQAANVAHLLRKLTCAKGPSKEREPRHRRRSRLIIAIQMRKNPNSTKPRYLLDL